MTKFIAICESILEKGGGKDSSYKKPKHKKGRDREE
jgi:hypothetical protein